MPPIHKSSKHEMTDWARSLRPQPNQRNPAIAARLYSSVNITFGASPAWTLVQYDTVAYTSPGMTDITNYPSRIFIPSSGLCAGTWRHNAGGTTLNTEGWLNAAGTRGSGTQVFTISNTGAASGAFDFMANAGDYLEIFVQQTTGSPVTTSSTGPVAFFLSLRLV